MSHRKEYWVIARDGLELRREPTMKPITEDGDINIILSVPPGETVMRERDRARTRDNHRWYYVRYMNLELDQVGWVIADHLREIEDAEAPFSDSYTFTFDGLSRTITEPNLEAAVNGNIISKSRLSSLQRMITLNKPYQNRLRFWASRENLKTITINPRVV